MDKRIITDWRKVFRFTLKQSATGKGFKGVTLGLIFLLFAGGIACNLIMAYSQKSDAKVSPITQVHMINNSGLEHLSVDNFVTEHKEKYPDVSFTDAEDSVEKAVDSIKKDSSKDASKQLIVELKKEDQKYVVEAIVPNGSAISEDEAKQFAGDFTSVVEQGKLMSLNIPVESIVVGMSDVSVRQVDAGNEQQGIGEEIIKIAIPFIFIFVMYFMNLVYGMNMGNIVSIEKTSKLMEYLLTITNPSSLIFGKILAMASVAIFQMLAWIGAFVGGFFAGDYLAKEMVYSQYKNIILEVLKLVQGQKGSTGFSVGAIVLAIIAVCFSFIFYCMLAGMIASFASKPENLAQTMVFYQIIMVLSFFASYTIPMKEKLWMTTLIRVIPFTSAYALPGDILTGNVTVLQGAGYLAILIVSLAVLIFATGKVYKNQLFNNGKVRKLPFLRK